MSKLNKVKIQLGCLFCRCFFKVSKDVWIKQTLSFRLIAEFLEISIEIHISGRFLLKFKFTKSLSVLVSGVALINVNKKKHPRKNSINYLERCDRTMCIMLCCACAWKNMKKRKTIWIKCVAFDAKNLQKNVIKSTFIRERWTQTANKSSFYPTKRKHFSNKSDPRRPCT